MPDKCPVNIKTTKSIIKGSIPVIFFKEGKTFVAYTPALDLSTCGSTYEEAQRRFGKALEIFFEECIKHGTLDEALQAYSWQRVGKPSPHWIPPLVVAHVEYPLQIPVRA